MSAPTRNGYRAHLERVDFGVDETAEGFMVFPGAPARELSVERTAENDHLFLYNPTSDRFEVIRYGSALIVSLLRMFQPERSELPLDPQTAVARQQLAVFDTTGNFHNNLVLVERVLPEENESISPDAKHTAHFLSLEKDAPTPQSIPIDDIFVHGLAKPRPKGS